MKTQLARQILSRLKLPKGYLDSVLEDLELMARYKYDHYEMYAPATRFFEYLYVWLKQFKTVSERKTAIEFILRRLIFVSQREMQDLARFLYYDVIVPDILEMIIRQERLNPFEYAKAFDGFYREYLRRCLFIGLSDGAQISFFRRHHIELSQEQVLPYYRTSHKEYLAALREETKDKKAKFRGVYLIDDFTASAYTLIHTELNKKTGEQRIGGALQRVYQHHKKIIDQADYVRLCHYISTDYAQKKILKLAPQIPGYKGKFRTSAVLTIPDAVKIKPRDNADAILAGVSKMCESYYSSLYETKNTKKGGGIKFGFGSRGLPIVLFSNTPNNSIYLLWLNTSDKTGVPEFHPLFRRIDRHRPK